MEQKTNKIHTKFGDRHSTSQTPPPSKTCEFCGKILHSHPLYHPFDKTYVLYWRDHERCTCDEAYVYWVAHDIQEEQKIRAQAESERMAKRMAWISRLVQNSCLKKRFLSRTFDRFDEEVQSLAYQLAKDFALEFLKRKEKGQGLYLQGPCGTGKTHLAAAISLHLLSEGVPVVFKTMMDLLQDIKNSYSKKEGAEGVLQVYKSVDLLVIDDMGKEPPTEWAVSTLYSIINDRYERCLPVVMTSNYNAKTLGQRLSKCGDSTTAMSIVDRLNEMTVAVTMRGESFRKLFREGK